MIQKFNTIFSTITVVLLFLLAIPAISQTVKGELIRGQVLDAGDNLPIPGVTVAEQDKENRSVGGVITDLDGGFAIKLKDPSHKLLISAIGYKTKTVTIGASKNIKVTLVSTIEELKSIVIISKKANDNGIMKIADRDRTTSSVTINAADLAQTQAASIDEALQGRMPGVDIVASSGDPGASMQIRIRGTSSISGSQDPLIVVDGMPFETPVPSDFNFATADDQGYAALLNVAPTDIDTITILKDAAATAIWGARAANGVLLITTKRGSISAPKISYTFRGTLSEVPRAIPMLSGDQYSQLIPEAFMNFRGVPLNTLTVKEFQYDPQDVYYFKNYSNNTDWLDAITQTGVSNEHNLSLQGGGQKAKYFTSVGYFDQKGVTVGTGFTRVNARLNLDYVVSDRIKFRTNIAYTNSTTNRNSVNPFGTNDADRLRGIAFRKMPNMSIYEYNEAGELTPNYFLPLNNIQRSLNPVAIANLATNEQVENRIVPHFNVTVDLVPKLLISTFDVQFDFSNRKTKVIEPQSATGLLFTSPNVNSTSELTDDSAVLNTKTNILFTPTIGKNQTLQSVLSIQTNDSRGGSVFFRNTNTASSLFTDTSIPSRTTSVIRNEGFGEGRSVGAVLNAQYGLLDRYIVNVAMRGDGNSKLTGKNRYGYFPSASLRWRISGESFMQKAQFVDDFSLRLSYGHAGNAPRNDYTFFNTYRASENPYIDLNGVVPNNMELTNLRWETVIGRNLGFNLNMFNNRVILDVDVYSNLTKDLFFANLQVPSISGFNTLSNQNVGTLQNSGWEIGLISTPFKSDKWKVDFNFNISSNQNVIKEISEFVPTESGSSIVNGSFKRFLQVDNPFGSFYGYRFKGVYKDLDATLARDASGTVITGPNGETVLMRFNYPASSYVFQPGDAMYEDINKDGNIDSRDVVYLGNSNPKFAGGFGTNVSWKSQFRLSLFFSYRLGFDVVNGTDMTTTNMFNYDNQSTAVLSRWRNPGDVTNMPRAVLGGGFNWLGSDRYVEDASFVRLRSITFNYTFKKDFIKKLRLDDLNFYVTGDNLFTFTNYRGQDPEVSMERGIFGIAIDNAATPPTRRFSFGLSTRF